MINTPQYQPIGRACGDFIIIIHKLWASLKTMTSVRKYNIKPKILRLELLEKWSSFKKTANVKILKEILLNLKTKIFLNEYSDTFKENGCLLKNVQWGIFFAF